MSNLSEEILAEVEVILEKHGLEDYLIVARGDGKGFFLTAGVVSVIMDGLIHAVRKYPQLAEMFCCIARNAKANCDNSMETMH